MTPEEYYKKEFKSSCDVVKNLKTNKLFSLESCFNLMEMYHQFLIPKPTKTETLQKINKIAEDVYYETICGYLGERIDTTDANEMKNAIKEAIIKGIELINKLTLPP